MDFGRVTLAESPIDRGDIFMYHKTTRRHVYEDAVAMSPESDDVLLFNEAGQITESTIANIALEIDGMFYTPPVSCGLLPGTRRAWMLDRAGLLERVISVGEVLESPNVYLMNSVRGMHKINIDTSGGPMASNRES
jgi:para-aminobenzoate synthetase/4-amino-4-deoxychorismate lyase